jgi:hypothetical protein
MVDKGNWCGHFTDEETEAQKGKTCRNHCRQPMADLGPEPKVEVLPSLSFYPNREGKGHHQETGSKVSEDRLLSSAKNI